MTAIFYSSARRRVLARRVVRQLRTVDRIQRREAPHPLAIRSRREFINMSRYALIVLLSLWPVASASAALRGRIVDEAGVPIADAIVTEPTSGEFAISDREGLFEIAVDGAPTELEVLCAGYRRRIVPLLDSAVTAHLEIALARQVGVFEQIYVSDERRSEIPTPESVAATTIDPLSVSAAPRVIGEAIAQVPGVAENGQGGIFRTYSIRGVSRGRVTTLVAGIPIVTERRAGASASFIDPSLVDSIEVLRGPSSTYYGSGAIGGVIHVLPRHTDGTWGRLGFATEGHEHDQAFGIGGRRYSLDLAHRAASNSRAPDGRELHSGFRQGAIVGTISGDDPRRDWTVEGIYSRGTDIRKSNADFPQRVTVYPEENHLLLRGRYAASPRRSFEVYLHDNDLRTDVVREDRLSDGFTEAIDFGGRLRMQARHSDTWSFDYGVEYFARRDVRGREARVEFRDDGAVVVDETSLAGGEEDEIGLYGALDRRGENGSLHLGMRWVGQRQGAASEESIHETALVGSVGITRAVVGRLTFASNVGFGTRFPSLTERYFSGTTARGVSIGNPGLLPERSAQIDAGLRWYGERTFVTVSAFYHRIRDYIERLEPAPDVQTTANLVSGEIRGLDGELAYRASSRWTVSLGGHLLDSAADGGGELADLPVNRVSLSSEGRFGRWVVRTLWQHRFAKGVVGPGERVLADADILSGSVGLSILDSLSMTLSLANLTDETYFPSADDSSDLAPRRSGALAVTWRR